MAKLLIIIAWIRWCTWGISCILIQVIFWRYFAWEHSPINIYTLTGKYFWWHNLYLSDSLAANVWLAMSWLLYGLIFIMGGEQVDVCNGTASGNWLVSRNLAVAYLISGISSLHDCKTKCISCITCSESCTMSCKLFWASIAHLKLWFTKLNSGIVMFCSSFCCIKDMFSYSSLSLSSIWFESGWVPPAVWAYDGLVGSWEYELFL